MTKIINLYGAPGAGKSTIAAGLFYQMKIKHYKVELAYEWIKGKVYDNSTYPFKDQIYTFAKQYKMLNQLRDKVDYVITDSPLLLCLIYGKNETDAFKDLIKESYNSFYNIDFFIQRNHEYEKIGRNQTEKESDDIAKEILNVLDDMDIFYEIYNSNEAIYKITDKLNL